MNRKYFILIGISVFMLVAGFFTAYYRISLTDPREDMIAIGKWHSARQVASPEASSWDKAFIAYHATFALQSSEIIYLSSRRDETGSILNEKCLYEVSGGKLPAFWWSVTIYGADGFLPKGNSRNAVVLDDVLSQGNVWSFLISSKSENHLRLPSESAGEFNLLLRLYVPEKDIFALRPEMLPVIRRVSCPG